MATNDCTISEEAINALLQEHTPITDDPAGEEAETQFQSLQRKLDALEWQISILNKAKQAMLKGNFESRARTFNLLDWDQGMIGSIDNTGSGYQIPRFLDYRWGHSELEAISAYEWNFAVTLQPFDVGSNQVESIAAGWHGDDVVPVSQTLKILDWCQKTIERIARTLTPDQIEQTFKLGNPDFGPPQSPFEVGRIILSNRLQQRIQQGEKQLVALRRRWNSLLPIAGLPVEILIQVLGFVLRAEPPERRDETYILCRVLMRICRDWTWIIINTPGLWNRISPYSSTLREVTMALDRSRPLPLSLCFNSAQMRGISLTNFFILIKEHTGRWRVLELHLIGLDAPIVLSNKLWGVFPRRLERLRVSMRLDGRGTARHVNFFDGRLPDSLKHFVLAGCRMDSSHCAELRGLATLELSQLPSHQRASVTEIIRILSNCPELEELVLGGAIVLDEQSAFLNPGLPVQLDRLRAISLSLEPAPMKAILTAIQVGNCTKFCIEAIKPQRPDSRWTESLLTDGIRPFIRVLESALSSASAISIKIDDNLIALATDPPDSDSLVRLTFRGRRLAEVGRWMANSLTLGPAPVTLNLAATGTTWIEALPPMLSNFNHIVKLTFVGLNSTYKQAIDFLGTPIHTKATSQHDFPAPRLACMDVMAEYISNLICMAGLRTPAGVAGLGRPARLSKLILRRKQRVSTRKDTLPTLVAEEVEWLAI
ncbi:hypothetical protein FRC04_004660 [Tulasnella sp. 424]|nr:hypothetical protein FRC04_004660 [Tulasnella sp. 424]KAG8964430.1 hypothetical protein FRC05_003804 [Tulasnella sp. 425]